MINFGTSAYLKLLALNPKPRDTELRNRLTPSEGGYDFHKAMRHIASRFASGEIDAMDIHDELDTIKRTPERQSAVHAINQLTTWLNGRSVHLINGQEKKYVSEAGLFSVKFTPDFVVVNDERKTLVHLWNTKHPKLTSREAIGTLGLFSREYTDFEVGVLCLRSRHLFAVTETTKSEELSRLLAKDIEKRIRSTVGDASDDKYRKDAEVAQP